MNNWDELWSSSFAALVAEWGDHATGRRRGFPVSRDQQVELRKGLELRRMGSKRNFESNLWLKHLSVFFKRPTIFLRLRASIPGSLIVNRDLQLVGCWPIRTAQTPKNNEWRGICSASSHFRGTTQKCRQSGNGKLCDSGGIATWTRVTVAWFYNSCRG